MSGAHDRSGLRTAVRLAACVATLMATAWVGGTAGADTAPRTALPASASALPSGATTDGPLDGSTPMHVEMALQLPDPDALQAFVTAVSTPGSPQYRQYLARGQFAARFGPSAAGIDQVRTWLASVGLTAGPTASDGLLVPATGTAAQIDAAFGTTVMNVRLAGGAAAYATPTAPSVPAGIAGVVSGVLGLDHYPEPPVAPAPGASAGTSTPMPTTPGGATTRKATTPTGVPVPSACPAATTAKNFFTGNSSYTQTTIAQMYGFDDLYDQGRLGYGQTIALVEQEPYTTHEIQTFEQCYGLDNHVRQVVVDGGGATYQEGEAALDIEQVAALAPGANIVAYDGSGTAATLTTIADDDTASVVSSSLGTCETGETSAQITSQSAALEQLAAQGQTVVAASGDGGSDDLCQASNGDPALGVSDIASQPDVLAAGGTMLPLPSSTPPTAAEQTVWNNCTDAGTACASSGTGGASTGGDSWLFTMPAWQQAAGTHGTVTSYSSGAHCGAPAGSYCREVPDVSAYADQRVGISIYTDALYVQVQSGVIPAFPGGWQSDAGTSAAAPLWAALLTDINQGCASPVGMVDPALYQLGVQGSGAFTDITTGNNDFTNTEGGDYPATTGYDLATGWGTPNAGPLAAGLQAAGGCPSLTGLSRHFSFAAGGGTLTISGSELSGATSAAVDGVDAPIVSDTAASVTVTVPPASPRSGHVTVTTANGTTAATPFTRFTYGQGYWEAASDGGIFAFGDATFHGSMGGQHLNAPIVGTAATPDGGGYWEVASDGGVFAFGDAAFEGSMGGRPLNAPIVGMATTPDGDGYWEVAADGGVFAFGDADYWGSMGGQHLDKPIVAVAATPDGGGYWEVASDGGVFAFGDAAFEGSAGGRHLDAPVVGLAGSADGNGYWEVASDGGIFTFGDAPFDGSTGGRHLDAPIVGLTATPDGGGYWEAASDGGIFAFGNAVFSGSMGGQPLNAPIVSIAASDG